MKTRLSKGIVIILFTNIFNMFLSIITNLVLPQNLSLESYAAIKTYQLYLSYVGILHFGIVDGVYLKFGGKNIESIKKDIEIDLYSFRVFQILILTIGLGFSIIIRDPVIGIVSVMVLPTNMLSFFKYLFQACGEYSKYGNVVNVVSFATFAVNIILIKVAKTDNYLYYLIGYLILNVAIWMIVERKFRKIIGYSSIRNIFSMQALYINMKSGILLTLGNFASSLATTMDRWFVKILIGTTAFAQYAFAVSMESFLNAAATPVSITLYNVFCLNNNEKTVENYRKSVIVFATVIVSAAYPVKYIIEVYLQKYAASVDTIFLLFSAQIFYIVIKSIYVNLYKGRKLQRKYFAKLIFSLIAGFIFNMIAYFMNNIKESYAIATVLTAFLWFLLVQLDFKGERVSFKEAVYIGIEYVIFIWMGFQFNSIFGFAMYILSVVLFSLLLMRNTVLKFVDGYGYLKDIFNR